MKALAIFLIFLLAFQTLFSTLIVTEARPLLPIMENPKNSFVKNIYNSPEVFRPSLPPPPSPDRASPPGSGYAFKFIQDLQLSEKFPSNQILFTTPTVTEARPFLLTLESTSNSFVKINPVDVERPAHSPPPPPHSAPPVTPAQYSPKPKSPPNPYELQVAFA